MNKFGLYTKGQQESNKQISIVNIESQLLAEAYFAGVKQIPLEQFKQLFIVKEITNNTRQILYGNR